MKLELKKGSSQGGMRKECDALLFASVLFLEASRVGSRWREGHGWSEGLPCPWIVGAEAMYYGSIMLSWSWMQDRDEGGKKKPPQDQVIAFKDMRRNKSQLLDGVIITTTKSGWYGFSKCSRRARIIFVMFMLRQLLRLCDFATVRLTGWWYNTSSVLKTVLKTVLKRWMDGQRAQSLKGMLSYIPLHY